MNNFFCTIGRELADKIQPAINPLLSGEYEVNKDKAKFHFKGVYPVFESKSLLLDPGSPNLVR